MDLKKISPKMIKLLGLSSREVLVFNALRAGNNTPLLIAKDTKVSRPAIYEILDRLHKRGLITSTIKKGKKYWSQAKDRDLEQEIYETKRALFDLEEGEYGVSDSTVVVHRGIKAIRKVLFDIMNNHKGQRLYTLLGDNPIRGWNKIIGIEGTNEINKSIKKNDIIVEMTIPFGWFERQIKLQGRQWAIDFEGRAAITHEIDEKYFHHSGQIFIFKQSLYLIAMNEEVIIEVRNSEIQKLILFMFKFIQDNSDKFNVNTRLQGLLQDTG